MTDGSIADNEGTTSEDELDWTINNKLLSGPCGKAQGGPKRAEKEHMLREAIVTEPKEQHDDNEILGRRQELRPKPAPYRNLKDFMQF